MSSLSAAGPNAARPARASASADLYRAVWRWHFYAGLLVLPFLVSLAVTGGLYLFRDEIEAIVHADVKRVEARDGAAALAPSALVAAALAAHPGTAVRFTDPLPGTSAEITVAPAGGGERLAVYVDPFDGRVLGSLPDRGTVMWTIRQLHSLKFFGSVARGAVEIAAGWSVLLVATGFVLWWPRGRGAGGVVTVRGRPRQRLFWRDLHAVTGAGVGLVVAFLAVTGMPWSVVWGAKVNEWANGTNFGYPAGVYTAVPMSDEHLAHAGPTSWTLERAQLPMSGGAAAGGAPVGLDAAVAEIRRLGLGAGFAVALPDGPAGVYSGTVYPDDVAGQRVVHLDQYSGAPLVDVGYAEYGPLARWLEWGISVHLGQEFGRPNQLALLAACLAVVLLCVSAATMWWKRRPSGRLGVPPLPADRRVLRGVVLSLALGGLVFPLVGASLLVMLALDLLVVRLARRPGAEAA